MTTTQSPDAGLDRPERLVVIPVAEIREYPRINAELARALDGGADCVRLAEVEGRRLLLAGLRGAWRAFVEVEGDAGPELAAEMDAPGVTVVARAAVGDGAGRGLIAGKILIFGDAGDAVGYDQRGGTIVVNGRAGHRAGLRQQGGDLYLWGGAGRLAGDRQAGGGLFVCPDLVGANLRHAATGGRLVPLKKRVRDFDAFDVNERVRIEELVGAIPAWLEWPKQNEL